MATYTFKDNDTGVITEHVMPMAELDAFKEAHPHLSLVIIPSKFISGRKTQPDAGFREVLRKIHNNNRGSNINTF